MYRGYRAVGYGKMKKLCLAIGALPLESSPFHTCFRSTHGLSQLILSAGAGELFLHRSLVDNFCFAKEAKLVTKVFISELQNQNASKRRG